MVPVCPGTQAWMGPGGVRDAMQEDGAWNELEQPGRGRLSEGVSGALARQECSGICLGACTNPLDLSQERPDLKDCSNAL